ncbi:MAG TPA: ATP-binding protein [Rickettsiales bacterium]|nr:ATP-binding protein [Rickettsiales bacterium]
MSYWVRFSRSLNIALVSALATAIGYGLYVQHKQTEDTQKWVVHTHEVREHIEKFIERANDISLSYRGYLLTHDRNYLLRYDKALQDDNSILGVRHRSIMQEWHILHELTDDNSYQQYNLTRLEKATQDLIAYAAASIIAYDKDGLKALNGPLDLVHGKLIMDAIRRITEEMLIEEDRLLKRRVEADAEALKHTEYMTLGSIGLFYAGITILLLLLHKNMSELKRKGDSLSVIVSVQREVAHLHHDLQTAMDIITHRMQAITNAGGGVIEMLEGDEMVYRAASGVVAPYVGMRIKALGSLSGLCVRENTTLRCDNTETDERVDKAACRKLGVASMVVVPLTREQQAVGVLKVMSSKVMAFNEEHVTILQLMAGVLSAALSDAVINDRLRQSEETFRAAMESASIGMALVNPDNTYKAVNPALCNLLGFTEEEFLSSTVQGLTHSEDIAEDLEKTNQLLKGEISSYEMEKRYLHKDGHQIWGLLNASLVRKADHTPHYLIKQVQDITAKKQLLAQLNQSNAQLNRFAYVASHDMQEPLRMMSNFAALIESEYGNKLDDEGREYIKFITDSATRMQNMVAGLLEYARVGKDAFRPQEINVMEDLAYILGNLSQAIKDCGAHVTYDMLPNIQGNPVQFTSLLQNLISNGLKYQAPGTAPEVHIGVEDAGDLWQFSVRDNGIGMEEEHTAKIFEPFVRLHSWQEYKGTGIGLSVCKEIVENHGGKIWVESKPGEGSTFYFTIPK